MTHEELYPEYYKEGGNNPFRIEGITQWVAVEAGYNHYEAPEGYTDEWLKTKSWLKADTGNLDRMLQFLFNGVKTDLKDLHP